MSSDTFLAGQYQALQLLVSGGSLESIFEVLAKLVEAEVKGRAVAVILVLDRDGKRLRHGAAPSLPDTYHRAIDGIAIGPNVGTCTAAAFRNETVVTTDIENDQAWSGLKDLPLGLGLRAAWSIPIRSAMGHVLGTFGTYFRECRAPTSFEREIVRGLAKTAAVAIEQRATESAWQRTLAEMESRVKARTTELAETNLRLRREIGQRKKTEKARQQLLQQLTTAGEQERQRISRELHDQVGQHLTALILGLKSLRLHLSGPRLETLRQLEAITETMGKEIHQLALDLRPTALDDLGLGPALTHYLEQWSERTGVMVQFRRVLPNEERFHQAVETAIYRLVQEALTNVAKHAEARRVAVAIERCADHVEAIVEDDGKGFDAQAAARSETSPRLGLRGMFERAANCGGTLNIESSLGQGTTVFARIPLPKAETGHA